MKPSQKQLLLQKARLALSHAYAPYSRFHVGAALQTASGHIFIGCNIENASFGLSLCAERAAICSAIAAGHNDFRALAVVSDGNRPPVPCGACRQVLSEFCAPDFSVFMVTLANPRAVKFLTLRQLLPHAFRLTPLSSTLSRRVKKAKKHAKPKDKFA